MNDSSYVPLPYMKYSSDIIQATFDIIWRGSSKFVRNPRIINRLIKKLPLPYRVHISNQTSPFLVHNLSQSFKYIPFVVHV